MKGQVNKCNFTNVIVLRGIDLRYLDKLEMKPVNNRVRLICFVFKYESELRG